MKSDHNLQVIIMSPPLTTNHSPPAEQAILLSHHVQKALPEGHCTLRSGQKLAAKIVQTHTSMIQMQVSEKSGRPSNLSSSFSSVFRNSAASAFEADVASTWRNIPGVQYRDEIQRSTIKKGLFISGYLHFLKQ